MESEQELPASDPVSSTTQTTPGIEASDVVADIECRREALGIVPSEAPTADRFTKVCNEILAKIERDKPTPEEAAEYERRIAAAREARRQAEIEASWDRLLGDRGTRYEGCRLSNYVTYDDRQKAAVAKVRDFCERMPEFQHEGRGLVFFGPEGTGKDHLLVSALRVAVFSHKLKPLWVNGMELFGELRDAIGADREESSVLRKYVSADVLAISDPLPPFGALTEYQASMLFRIVDSRYSRMLPTWATLNVRDGEEGSQRLGAQVVGRLRHGAVSVHCNWASYRK